MTLRNVKHLKLKHYSQFAEVHVQKAGPNAVCRREKEVLYRNMTARPRTPAPTIGAAVLAAKPLDVDEDELPPLLPVPACAPFVLLALDIMLLELEVEFAFPFTLLAFTKFAQPTVAMVSVSGIYNTILKCSAVETAEFMFSINVTRTSGRIRDHNAALSKEGLGTRSHAQIVVSVAVAVLALSQYVGLAPFANDSLMHQLTSQRSTQFRFHRTKS